MTSELREFDLRDVASSIITVFPREGKCHQKAFVRPFGRSKSSFFSNGVPRDHRIQKKREYHGIANGTSEKHGKNSNRTIIPPVLFLREGSAAVHFSVQSFRKQSSLRVLQF